MKKTYEISKSAIQFSQDEIEITLSILNRLNDDLQLEEMNNEKIDTTSESLIYTFGKEDKQILKKLVNKFQNKTEIEYSELLTRAFLEIRRVLKDNAWFTVMFHNSSKFINKKLRVHL